MKNVLYILITLLTLTACNRTADERRNGRTRRTVDIWRNGSSDADTVSSSGGKGAAEKVCEVFLSHTPVKNQGHISACWIYAYLACIETERIEQYGDSLNLSPLWLIENAMQEQAAGRYLTKGKRNITFRGIGPEAEYLLKRCGMVPYSFFLYDNDMSSGMVERDITNKVDIAIRMKKGTASLRNDVAGSLPHMPHNLEQGFYLYGMHYTPQEFGNSLLAGTSMQWLTSYTHHPFHEPFDIELPDNIRHHCIMNVPIDSLYAAVITALSHRHPVFWEGRMPRQMATMAHRKGVHASQTTAMNNAAAGPSLPNAKAAAVPSLCGADAAAVPSSPRGASCPSQTTAMNKAAAGPSLCGNKAAAVQSARQRAFERYEVTDDHAMAIIGMAQDKDGNTVFICKNSWGKEWGDHGFCLMKAHDFLLNTILVGVMGK